MADDQDERIAEIVSREEGRLRGFIRRRVADSRDAEDVLQDVFAELVEANRLLMPIEHVTGWLYRVARNRITDLFRKKRPEPLAPSGDGNGGELPGLEDLLAAPGGGPDAEYRRTRLLEALERALDELPALQREVWIAHELEGESFREMADRTGVGVNTLLTRKRRAVLHLRKRLAGFHDA
ncbi:MAG: RNA polymerase sigma factor [Vicinamibacterales bacterium]